ncbi:inorganic phosphate transporter [Pseudoflavonifractor sp. CLA-AP-H29]|uniref:Inorganic phosphate transporter n=1 Tax=Pseudoflavonifractor intestinihominis TaxID=3133171 RepID=A0ABV1E5H5_9FIRM
MPLSLSEFLRHAAASPALAGTALLLLAVILVNGWTDAPNAIASAVVSGVLPFRRAAWLAAACNLLGSLWAAAAGGAVLETVFTLADFGRSASTALAALCAAMTAIVCWAVLAWRFGIPTSESHALVAGLSGAAAALPGGLSNLRPGPWLRVAGGLVLSVALGAALGRGAARWMEPIKIPPARLARGQILAAGAMAFLHGAQDGQKFMGVFLLGAALAQGRQDWDTFPLPLWLALLCGGVMALGTALGGKRIVAALGRAAPLTPQTGLAADLGGGLCLLLCTLLGLPVSTTHVKTAAILGAGRGGEPSPVLAMALAWLLTFPGCALLGFAAARLFLAL